MWQQIKELPNTLKATGITTVLVYIGAIIVVLGVPLAILLIAFPWLFIVIGLLIIGIWVHKRA
jgi:hypothetical protein